MRERKKKRKDGVSEEFSQVQSMALDRAKIRKQRTEGTENSTGLSCCDQCYQPGE